MHLEKGLAIFSTAHIAAPPTLRSGFQTCLIKKFWTLCRSPHVLSSLSLFANIGVNAHVTKRADLIEKNGEKKVFKKKQPIIRFSFAQASPIKVCVTGAAGQIAYSLLYSIASGEVFGRDQVHYTYTHTAAVADLVNFVTHMHVFFLGFYLFICFF